MKGEFTAMDMSTEGILHLQIFMYPLPVSLRRRFESATGGHKAVISLGDSTALPISKAGFSFQFPGL
jgi:hypothetical protein